MELLPSYETLVLVSKTLVLVSKSHFLFIFDVKILAKYVGEVKVLKTILIFVCCVLGLL